MLIVKLSRNGILIRELRYPVSMGIGDVAKNVELIAHDHAVDGDVAIAISLPPSVRDQIAAALASGWNLQ